MNDSTLRQNQDNRHFFLSLALVLVGFGVLMVHSASITSWPTEFGRVYLTKHLKFLAIAITAASIAGALPARFWFKAAPWLFAGTLLLLIAVLIPGVGTRVNGAQRWLRLAGFSMQPSELAKVTLPLFLARGILLCRERLSHWFFGTVPFIVPTILTAGLVMLEPDLGTSAFLVGSAGLVLFFGGWPIRNFTVGIGAAASAGVFLITVTSYRMRRITDFVSVWTDFRNSDAWQLAWDEVRRNSASSPSRIPTLCSPLWEKNSDSPERPDSPFCGAEFSGQEPDCFGNTAPTASRRLWR
mgnify:CR=1 FL=1